VEGVKGLKTQGVTSPPLYFGTVFNAYTKHESKFQNLFKKLSVLCPHGIFMLPGSIFRTVAGPLNFYHLYNSVPENFDFYVQYLH
jgi:hypothetical protein